jgi:pheromone shutdown protein TraB
MHYNPLSISSAKRAVEDLGEAGLLGSVVIESCSQRWERTLSMQPAGSLLRSVFDNEMQAAQEACEKFQRPVILGDQAIEVTNARVKESFVTSLKDLGNPITGWTKLAADISDIFQNTILLPFTPGVRYLNAGDFLNPSLLLASPMSLVRYPLALALRSPALIAGFLLLSFTAGQADGFASSSDALLPSGEGSFSQVVDIFESVLLSAAELVVLARPMFQAILLERNVVLAESIRESCRAISREQGKPSQRVCLAVLGMAHSNGVAKLLAS